MTQNIIKPLKYFVLFVLATFSLISCSKDWLDAKADVTAVVPESLLEFQGLLDNHGRMHQLNPSCGELGSDNQYVSDETFNATGKSFLTDAYIWSKTLRYQNTEEWGIPYNKVLIDNVILDGLEKITPNTASSEIDWKNIKGQALFHRSCNFFMLLTTYSEPYDAATAGQAPGIPLRLTSDIAIPTTRGTVEEAYNRIIQDLIQASNLLPITQKFPTRPSKAAAYGLLSRVYLSMGDYENCLSAATECLKLNDKLLDYNTVPAADMFMGRYNVEVMYHSNFAPAFITYAAIIDSTLLKMYDDHDLRKTRYFFLNWDGTISYKGSYESLLYNFFDGVATDEIYLNRAECYARLNKTTEAMVDLNMLMKKRWDNSVPFPEISASNPEEALIKILRERRKELVLRNLRWMDLRRLNKDPRFAVTISRILNGQTITLEPNSPKYAFPIPDDIIEQTGIIQNSAWKK